ncbi:hypothetical protein N7528_009708 [Penicillium herquei]|nr:hypothetical protein N7528_009708 [Penicillium herquei]
MSIEWNPKAHYADCPEVLAKPATVTEAKHQRRKCAAGCATTCIVEMFCLSSGKWKWKVCPEAHYADCPEVHETRHGHSCSLS